MLNPITVHVRFPPMLEAITGRQDMPITMSDGAPFLFLLDSVFTSYPEIPRRYPPGTLGMTLNDRPPAEYDVLRHGDRVSFFI